MVTREACEAAGGPSADAGTRALQSSCLPWACSFICFSQNSSGAQPWGQSWESWDEFGAQLKGRCWAWPASSALCNFTGPRGSSGLGNGLDARLFYSGMFPLTLE